MQRVATFWRDLPAPALRQHLPLPNGIAYTPKARCKSEQPRAIEAVGWRVTRPWNEAYTTCVEAYIPPHAVIYLPPALRQHLPLLNNAFIVETRWKAEQQRAKEAVRRREDPTPAEAAEAAVEGIIAAIEVLIILSPPSPMLAEQKYVVVQTLCQALAASLPRFICRMNFSVP